MQKNKTNSQNVVSSNNNKSVSLTVDNLAAMLQALNTVTTVLSSLTQTVVRDEVQNTAVRPANVKNDIVKTAPKPGIARTTVNRDKKGNEAENSGLHIHGSYKDVKVQSNSKQSQLQSQAMSGTSGRSPYKNDEDKGVFYSKVGENHGRLRIPIAMFTFADSNKIKVSTKMKNGYETRTYVLSDATDARPKVQGKDLNAEIGQYVKFAWSNKHLRYITAVMTDVAGVVPIGNNTLKTKTVKGTVASKSNVKKAVAPVETEGQARARKMREGKARKQAEREAIAIAQAAKPVIKDVKIKSANEHAIVSEPVHTSPKRNVTVSQKTVTNKPKVMDSAVESLFERTAKEAKRNFKAMKDGAFKANESYEKGDIRRYLDRATRREFNSLMSRLPEGRGLDGLANCGKQAFQFAKSN